MTDTLRHRGPDSGGCWHSPGGELYFGHRRLAIIDLSPTGEQPMSTPDGRFTLSFNGEIYNFQELRTELQSSGVVFRGSSDTEVLLHALARWGVKNALQRLNGMFAFALWDEAEKELYLARDRFGEKPMFYAWHNGVLIFGSELKALVQHPAFRREIDSGALALYVRFNYVPWPHCIYRDAHKLPPAHFLCVKSGQAPGGPKPYWDIGEMVKKRQLLNLDPRDPQLIDLVERELRRAVKMRMVADVPLGALLSGGIDSSLVVALMQAQSSRPVKTYTIGFWKTGYNEAEDAMKVARHLGTDHHEFYLSSRETMDVIGKLPQIYDEPFADSSQIPTTLVSQFTRQHVTVALTGDAGDELFGGYNRYFWSNRIWPILMRTPKSVRRLIQEALLRFGPDLLESVISAINPIVPSRLRIRSGGEKMHKLAQALVSANPDELYLYLVSQWQDPLAAVNASREPDHLLNHPEAIPGGLHFVDRMVYWDQLTYLPSDILCKVDRASMAASLETRVPFLDNNLVQLAWSLPLQTRIYHGVGKWPLRQVLKRYVPEKLFERPKAGFGIPIGGWLRGPLKEWAEELLSERRLGESGMFNVENIRRQWAAHLSGRRNVEHSLWSILMFQAWAADQAKVGTG